MTETMDRCLTSFSEIFVKPEAISKYTNEDLEAQRSEMLGAFRKDSGLLKDPRAVDALAGLTVVMNFVSFKSEHPDYEEAPYLGTCTPLERKEVRDMMETALEANPERGTAGRIQTLLNRVVNGSRDWAPYLMIASSMACASKTPITEDQQARLDAWAAQPKKRSSQSDHLAFFRQKTSALTAEAV